MIALQQHQLLLLPKKQLIQQKTNAIVLRHPSGIITANPQTATIPVIMCTGHDTPQDRARAKENGASGFVTKPVDDSTLDGVLADDFDMIVLPGGMPGAQHLREDRRIIGLLKRMAEQGKFTAAICAAPTVLAEAGLLEGKRATSYPGFLDKMGVPGMAYLKDAVVRDGKILTSRGPGTAMDFALALIEALSGKAKRDEVETGLVRA